MVPLGTPDQPLHGTPLDLPVPIHPAAPANTVLPESLDPPQTLVLEPGPADAVPLVAPQEILLENLYLRRRVQDLEAIIALYEHKHQQAVLPEPTQVVLLEQARAVAPEPAQAIALEPAPVVPPVVTARELLLENMHLRRRIQDLEAIVQLRNDELEIREAELVHYRIGDLGADQSPPPPPPPFVRPQPTVADLLISSMWAKSGCADPSVEGHPPSSWYLWFRSTPPFPSNDNDDFLILEPPEPALSPDEQRPIPYSLPQYVLPLLGAEARLVDKKLAEEAKLLFETGQKQRPPSPIHRPRRLSLGRWDGIQIITVLQAHNLRHHAVTDHDKYAIRTYKQVHTTFTDRTKPRSEGTEYLMKAFSGDVRYFS